MNWAPHFLVAQNTFFIAVADDTTAVVHRRAMRCTKTPRGRCGAFLFGCTLRDFRNGHAKRQMVNDCGGGIARAGGGEFRGVAGDAHGARASLLDGAARVGVWAHGGGWAVRLATVGESAD